MVGVNVFVRFRTWPVEKSWVRERASERAREKSAFDDDTKC